MTTKYKATRRKLSLLELAQEMSNVPRACRIMSYSRQQFCELRRNYQTYGAVLREHPRDADRPRRLPGHVQHPEAPSGPWHERQDACERLPPLPAENQKTNGGQNGKCCLDYSRPGAAGIR